MIRRIGICLCISSLVWVGGIIGDRERLNENLIRLHVVAASDSREDQDLKLLVRDAVTESLQEAMADIRDAEQAKAYLQENLPKIEQLARNIDPDCFMIVTRVTEVWGRGFTYSKKYDQKNTL